MKGLYKDIKDYRYTKNCFKMMLKDSTLQSKYDLRMTTLGVLYTYVVVPSGTPREYHDEVLTAQLRLLDMCLVNMNLEGVARLDYRFMGQDENEEFLYLIKVIPVFNRISWWYFVRWGFIIFVAWWLLINKLQIHEEENIRRVLESLIEMI